MDNELLLAWMCVNTLKPTIDCGLTGWMISKSYNGNYVNVRAWGSTLNDAVLDFYRTINKDLND